MSKWCNKCKPGTVWDYRNTYCTNCGREVHKTIEKEQTLHELTKIMFPENSYDQESDFIKEKDAELRDWIEEKVQKHWHEGMKTRHDLRVILGLTKKPECPVHDIVGGIKMKHEDGNCPPFRPSNNIQESSLGDLPESLVRLIESCPFAESSIVRNSWFRELAKEILSASERLRTK